MFLAIDECLAGGKNVIGGLLTKTDDVSLLEKDFTDLRIKHKLFGEIKWNHLSKYSDRYCEFIDLFFNNAIATYHSICYTRSKYNAAYTLIRNITWKLDNEGINEPIYVLFDNDGELGNIEAKKIKELADKDHKFKCPVEFCNQGTSHVLGVLQIADLLTGCVCVETNNLPLNPQQTIFFEHVKKRNGGNLTYYSPKLPKLNDHKIHFLDPDQIPTRLTVSNLPIAFDAEIVIPEGTSQSKLIELNNLLKSSTGVQKIVVKLPNGKNIPIDYGINYSNDLTTKIKEILG